MRFAVPRTSDKHARLELIENVSAPVPRFCFRYIVNTIGEHVVRQSTPQAIALPAAIPPYRPHRKVFAS